jgi:hypothetical protein
VPPSGFVDHAGLQLSPKKVYHNATGFEVQSSGFVVSGFWFRVRPSDCRCVLESCGQAKA